MENNQSLSIYFGEGSANLYSIGYISTDIFRILVFSEFIRKRDETEIELYFGDKWGFSRPFYRTARISREHINFSTISDVKKGSVELIIDGVSLATTIIMNIVNIYLQDILNNRNQRLTFNLKAGDSKLQNIFEEFKNGDFGRGDNGLNNLFEELRKNNYDVEAIEQYVFKIVKVSKRSAQKMAMVLRVH